MKVIASMNVLTKENGLYEILHKDIETSLIPVEGMDYEDSTFNDPVKITSVTCNFDNHYYYITLPKVEFDSEDAAKEFTDMTKLHGWTSS